MSYSAQGLGWINICLYIHIRYAYIYIYIYIYATPIDIYTLLDMLVPTCICNIAYHFVHSVAEVLFVPIIIISSNIF